MIPAIETASLTDIRAYQDKKLKELLPYLQANSPYYQRLFKKYNIDIDQIRTVADLTHLPVTTKTDLQKHNEEFLCVERNKIIDYITTSGTLGDPVTFAMTEKDLERLAYNEAVSISCPGIGANDVIQLTTTMDKRYMAGLAYFLGARKLGAGIIRVGAGIPELQWDSINRFKPTTLIAVPSFLLKLIQYAEEHSIDYTSSPIKQAICIGETIRNNDLKLTVLAQRIKEKWPIDLYSTYASTEMGAAFTECQFKHGGHHHPELLIVEFLDQHNQPVADGEPGEVTITSLGIEGMPLLRFKTGDICHHYTEPCSCGRNTLRVGPVLGRRQQMIKFKGTTLYPSALYNVLDTIEFVTNYQVEVSTNNIGTDDITIFFACKTPPENYEKIIKDHFRAVLRVTPNMVIKSHDQIEKDKYPGGARKPLVFIDRRGLSS